MFKSVNRRILPFLRMHNLRCLTTSQCEQILRINHPKEPTFSHPTNKEELKKIYLQLAKLYHPDNTTSGMGSKDLFQQLQDAYDHMQKELDIDHKSKNDETLTEEEMQRMWEKVEREKARKVYKDT